MANYSALNAAIRAVIKENHREEITGPILQASLLSMVSSLGAGYQFVGFATPASAPGTPDERVFYLATTAGTYTNYGSITVADGEVAVLAFDTAWHKVGAWAVGGLSLAQMWASLANTEADDFADVQIAAAHLVGYVTEDSLADTLQDYVRQSAFGAISDTLASHETRLTDLEGLVADGALGGGASVDWFIEESYVYEGQTRRRLKLNPAYAGLYANGWIVAGGVGDGGGQQGGSLASLSDVSFGTLSDGDIIRYDALTSHWVNGPLEMSLGQLTDVTLGTPLDGQALVYDAANHIWKPGTVGGGGSVTVVSADATIGTSLTSLGTINGVAIRAKIASYLEISQFTASNIVSALGTTPVNRATADASGNTIKTYYAANLIYSNNELLLKNGNNTTISTITGANILGMLGLSTSDTIATQAWVGQQGYLTSSALNGYATQTWVNQQGFLTSSALTGYATQSWVTSQGYVTSSALSGYMLAADYTGTGTSVVNRARSDADGNIIKNYYAANLVVYGGELLLKNGANTTISTITGGNIVTVIGNNAVARATADASGNAFATSYLRKDVDDTMAGNLTIGASGSTKTLMVYGNGTFSTSLDVGSDASFGGNVTIGAQTGTNTAKALTIYGRNNSTNPALNIYGVASSSTRYLSSLYTASDGLHITTTLNVTGNITATGNIVAGTASDRRLKEDIRDLMFIEAEDALSHLRPVVYRWNEKAGELGNLKGFARGFIADEFNEVILNATRKIWEDYDAIDYEQVIPYLVAGWQAQRARIKSLEGEIANLKMRLGYGV